MESDNNSVSSTVSADDPESLACKLCHQKFMCASTLRRHQKNHEASLCRGLQNEEFICLLCNKLFYVFRKYNTHMLKCHFINTAKSPTNSSINASLCPYCHQEFSNVDTLKTHLCSRSKKEKIPVNSSSESDETRLFFDCDICNRRCNSKRGIRGHVKKHLPRSFYCDVCHHYFASKAALLRHEKNKNDKVHKLENKKRVVKKRILLKSGDKISTSKPVQEANRKFVNEEQVSAEKSSSENDQSASVPMCQELIHESLSSEKSVISIDQVIANEEMLAEESVLEEPLLTIESVDASEQMQLREQISDSNNPVQMPPSEQILISNSPVPENIQVQSSSIESTEPREVGVINVKSFACTVCSRQFYTEHTMQLHINTHKKLPQIHHCILCNFSSENQLAFSLHVLDHYKKKFKCDICDRLFYTKSTMELHAETHLPSQV